MNETNCTPLPCWNCKKPLTEPDIFVVDQIGTNLLGPHRNVWRVHPCCRAQANTEPVATFFTKYHGSKLAELFVNSFNAGPKVEELLAKSKNVVMGFRMCMRYSGSTPEDIRVRLEEADKAIHEVEAYLKGERP